MDEPEFDPFKKMDCNECNETLQAVMSAPRVQILLNALTQNSEGPATSDDQMQSSSSQVPGKQALATSRQTETITMNCRMCSEKGVEGGARAFIETPPTAIVLCANRLRGKKEVEEALVHELIHAYDFCVKGRDLFDCHQLAYSEVRAARESECFYRNIFGSYGPAWFKETMTEKCIEKNAINATKSIFPKQASACVASMFSKAVQDLEPFHTPSTKSEPNKKNDIS